MNFINDYEKRNNTLPKIMCPIRENHKLNWSKLWILLMIIMILVLLFIIFYEEPPLNECDILKYVGLLPVGLAKAVPKQNVINPNISQKEANIYALTHDASSLSKLSSKQLLNISSNYVPNLVDFAEDDFH
jgi:hypothetical protein